MYGWESKQRQAERKRAAMKKGIPVPGSGRGNKCGSKHPGKRNPAGSLSGGMEWGAKARKEEARQRGLNNRARREAIQDQLA